MRTNVTMTYLNRTHLKRNRSRVTKALSTTSRATTVSIISTPIAHTAESPQPYSLSAALIAFICITVFLLITIIILLLKWRSDRKRLFTYIRSRDYSRPLTDADRGYVEPNNVIPSKRQEIRKPDAENMAHDYIYLKDNALPDADMKTRPPERIPEIIYSDSSEPCRASSKSNKDHPIYHMIDTEAESEPKAKPDERTSDPDLSSTNLYHVVEPDDIAEKANS